MSNNYFEQLKQSFLVTYAADLCEESLADIANAKTVAAFIAVLHKYLHFLNYKAVPTAEWAREWFGRYLDEANANGVYLDQIIALDDTHPSVVLLGRCVVNAVLVKSKTTCFTLQDESSLSLVTYGTANATVRLKSPQCTCEKIHCSPYSRIKIRRV